MFIGVDYAGIIVSDIERSLAFYRDTLGFRKVQDCTVIIPKIDRVSRKETAKVRTIFLKSKKTNPLGRGKIKLSQFRSLEVYPIDRKYIWGAPGIAEFALNVCNIEGVVKQLEEKRVEITLQPKSIVLGNRKVKYAYIRDTDSILIELIEIAPSGRCESLPEIEGINHVGIGVSDIERSLAFYRDTLGFRTVVWEHTGIFDGLSPLEKTMSPLKPVKMRVVMLKNKEGSAWIELVQRFTSSKTTAHSAPWNRIGHSEVGIKVSNLDQVCTTLRERKVKVFSSPETIEFNPSEGGKYAKVLDPDNAYVSLFET